MKLPQGSFARGELSPRMYGRDDTELYYSGLKHCLNFVVTQTGSIQRRPGTICVEPTKDGGPAWIYGFEFSDEQAYIIEAGESYFRFFSEDVQVQNVPGTPFEITTPYTGEEWKELTTAQSTDTLYVTHPNHPPYVLKRTSATTFFFSPVQFDPPPMRPQNQDKTAEMTITGSSFIATQGQVTTTGTVTLSFGDIIQLNDANGNPISITVTDAGPPIGTNYTDPVPIPATSNFLVNGAPPAAGDTIALDGGTSGGVSTMTATGHAPFTATDVGRSWRIFNATGTNDDEGQPEGTWYTFEVTSFISATQVETNYTGPSITTATELWAAGAFYEGNYPTAVAFFQDRLVFANTPQDPQAVWMSAPGDYLNFAQTDPDASTNDDNAILAVLNDYEVNPIYWLRPSGSDLLAATSSGIYTVGPSYDDNILSPSSVRAQFQGATGAADLEPVRTRGEYVYTQSKGKKLITLVPPEHYRALYGSSELSLTAQHLPYCGVRDMAYQEEPYSIIWVVTSGGELAACTYVPEQQMTAWHRHRIGGYHEVDGFAQAESVKCIPSPRGDTNKLLPGSDYDQLWLVVNRDGTRCVERLQQFCGFPCAEEVEPTYLDGGGTYNQPYQSYAEMLDPNYDMGGPSRGNKARTPEVYLHFYKSVLEGSEYSGSTKVNRTYHAARWVSCEDPNRDSAVPNDGILNIHAESGYSRSPHFSFRTDAPVHVEILKMDTDRVSGRA